MPAANRPHGKSVCPKVNLRCAKAIAKYLSYCVYGAVENSPTDEEEAMVRSFLKNINLEIIWEERRRARIEESKSRNAALADAQQSDGRMERRDENNS